VVVPRLGLVPIRYYLREGRPLQLAAPPTPVRLLDALSVGPARPSPGDRFHLVSSGKVAGGEFSLSTFRAPHPVAIRASALKSRNLIGEPSRTLLTGVPRPG
jgi:hypothetical protein